MLPKARGDQTQNARLEALGQALISENEGARQKAIFLLSRLDAFWLDAISQRLEWIGRNRPPQAEVEEALRLFSTPPETEAFEKKIGAVLAEKRSEAVRSVAETLLLLKALERIGTTEALRLMLPVLSWDGGAWSLEMRRIALRLGDKLAPIALEARVAAPQAAARAWARAVAERLRVDEPGELVQRLSGKTLADTLRAYGRLRIISAMPVVAAFVDSEQRIVRQAAREALRSYGQNALWVARESFRLRLGEDPDLRWGWERTMDELFRRLDEKRASLIRQALEEAHHALESGEISQSQAILDRALLVAPEAANEEVARFYAKLEERLSSHQGRILLLHRAIAIAPQSEERQRWQDKLALEENKALLARDVLDFASIVAMAHAQPSCTSCQSLAQWAAQFARPRSRRRAWVWLGASAAFVLLALLSRMDRGSALTQAQSQPNESTS
ncbi:MAG: hypothetical protein NZM37_09400 [Sandaracinaceae bacterium]|nr:hypothetical protein [Sandaracinaceae bacterium]MDW8245811.1 hypothetical protein [Sandaracinaceae bacterium]